MIISVKAPSELTRNDFDRLASDRIVRVLARFAHRITSVNLTLTEQNGPRGGTDYQCRVVVTMSGAGPLTTSARHDDPMGAVRLTIGRARRKVLTGLKRPAALRIRRHKFAPQRSTTHAEGALPI